MRRIEAPCRLSLFFFRGHGCGKALNYKGIWPCASKAPIAPAHRAYRDHPNGFAERPDKRRARAPSARRGPAAARQGPDAHGAPRWAAVAQRRTKKNPNSRLGLNPPKEEGGGDMRRSRNTAINDFIV